MSSPTVPASAPRTAFLVGTRDSQLALTQTDLVRTQLAAAHPHLSFPRRSMTTIGDRILSQPLSSIGTTALFTKELETALIHSDVDLVVHSLKDVPTAMPAGLVLAAVLERQDPRDALVVKQGLPFTSLHELPSGSVIGTSSRRRTAQLRRAHPALTFHDVRGNLNTRLAKLDAHDSPYTALVLATAGLVRLGWTERITQRLDADATPYAVGQGALAVQCRENDATMVTLLRGLNHERTWLEVEAERAVMVKLQGGCSVPLGVRSTWLPSDVLQLYAVVTRMDGSEAVEARESGIVTTKEQAAALGLRVANAMLENGAAPILVDVKTAPIADFNV